MGTCAMKPRAEGGVVDPNLNVYGIEGLKVAGTHSIVAWLPSTISYIIFYIRSLCMSRERWWGECCVSEPL